MTTMRASGWWKVLLLPAVFCLSSMADGAQTWLGRANCRVAAPATWHAQDVAWSGRCEAGKATGRGVLRGLENGRDTSIFLGVMHRGELSAGVIEVEGGYIAGRFRYGRVVRGANRNDMIGAFDHASAAAREYGESLRKAGDGRAADLYFKKAKELEQQMD